MPEPLPAEMPGLMKIVNGFEQAAVVLGAAQLDLFSPLANGPLTAAELAAQTGLPLRGVARLLNASAALGFVTKEAERYHNSPLADAFLVKDKPGYVGNMLKQASDRYQAWGKLPEAIRTDTPILPLTGAELEHAAPEVLDNYVHGLFELGKGLAERITGLVDLKGASRLLDVAGGSGVYSIRLCQAFPQLSATVFDLPPILRRTRHIIEREGMAARVRFGRAIISAMTLAAVMTRSCCRICSKPRAARPARWSLAKPSRPWRPAAGSSFTVLCPSPT